MDRLTRVYTTPCCKIPVEAIILVPCADDRELSEVTTCTVCGEVFRIRINITVETSTIDLEQPKLRLIHGFGS